MKCVAPNLASFQGLVSELTSLPNVRNVRTALTLNLVKDEPLVPIEDVAAVEVVLPWDPQYVALPGEGCVVRTTPVSSWPRSV